MEKINSNAQMSFMIMRDNYSRLFKKPSMTRYVPDLGCYHTTEID